MYGVCLSQERPCRSHFTSEKSHRFLVQRPLSSIHFSDINKVSGCIKAVLKRRWEKSLKYMTGNKWQGNHEDWPKTSQESEKFIKLWDQEWFSYENQNKIQVSLSVLPGVATETVWFVC